MFVFVRQFRPAVFCKSEAAKTVPWNPETPPVNEYSTEPGKTWELCAGIIGILRFEGSYLHSDNLLSKSESFVLSIRVNTQIENSSKSNSPDAFSIQTLSIFK